ncbi:hypothetical protein CPB84DRAFT_168769 [Gymnopilus junonius]|uniref:F-box domain-containing protein n=1 Tax=Gymnopilus junonius TaxID=109634 RepID=A0A9P5NYD3_GYMJU|nr:hypothetical protein CPB84DRAFT_168769 [Gymnopilus junonius]
MTPNPTTDPPIFNLNEDLLWSIFHLNADMFTDQKALETTRLTSQVCSSWRNLMLAAPSLWGRLIDLDALLRNSADRWGHELLRRNGEALLWIKSSSIIAEAPLALLLYVLEGSWFRIQRLALSINSFHFKANAKIWDKFYLPAPHLQNSK